MCEPIRNQTDYLFEDNLFDSTKTHAYRRNDQLH